MLDNCPNFQLLVIGKVRGTRVFVISLGYRLYLPGVCWNIQCQVRGKAIQRNFRLSQPLMQRYISRMKNVIKPMCLDRAVVTAHHHFVHCHYVHYVRLSWSRSIRLTWFVTCSIPRPRSQAPPQLLLHNCVKKNMVGDWRISSHAQWHSLCTVLENKLLPS